MTRVVPYYDPTEDRYTEHAPRGPVDLKRLKVMKSVVHKLVESGNIDERGVQSRIAEHFKVSRQRVHQLVVEEKRVKPNPDQHWHFDENMSYTHAHPPEKGKPPWRNSAEASRKHYEEHKDAQTAREQDNAPPKDDRPSRAGVSRGSGERNRKTDEG